MVKCRYLAYLLVIPLLAICNYKVQADTYMPSDLYGGWINRVVAAPSAPGTMYASSYGIHKSIDGGKTWVRLDPPEVPTEVQEAEEVFGRHQTNSVAVSPGNADLIVVGDSQWSPIWRSDDGGSTWTVISFGAVRIETWKRSNVVASSYSDNNTFFAAVEDQVFPDGPSAATLYKSTDGGLSWSSTGLSVTDSQTITGILQIPSGMIIVSVIDVYAGFFRHNSQPPNGKIYYSNDGGTTFTAASITKPIYRMTWDATNNQIWAITALGEVYNSSDGSSWGAPVATLSSFYTTDYTPAGILYAATTPPCMFAFGNTPNHPLGAVYRSTDSAGGFPAASWEQITLPAVAGQERVRGFIHDIAVDLTDADGTNWGVADTIGAYYYTLTSSMTTTTAGEFFRQTGIATTNLIYGKKDESTNRIYSLAYKEVYFSSDNGSTWASVYPAKGSTADTCYHITLDPTNVNRAYLTAILKVYYTDNNGTDNFGNTLVDFTAYGYNTTTHRLTNMVINSATGKMFTGVVNKEAASTGNYLYSSDDNGATWTAVSSLTSHGICFLAMDPDDNNILYAACADSYVKGQDFSGNGDGLYKSTDGGVTWSLVGFDGTQITYISINDSDTDVVAVGYQDYSRAWSSLSTDGGASWSLLSAAVLNDDGTESSYAIQSEKCFVFDDIVYCTDSEGRIYRGNNFNVTPMELITIMPTNVNWMFKGSIYAVTEGGLYNIEGTVSGTVRDYSGTELKLYNFPNPFNPGRDVQTSIRIFFPSDVNRLDIKLYSLSGDLVDEESFDNITGAHSYVFAWNGKNREGRLCAPGLYFIVADADGTIARHKIVMVR